MKWYCLSIFTVLFIFVSSPVRAEISVVDFRGRTVHLQEPAKRIVALAPHIVENLYAAGAGSSIVGAVDYCDYPEAAKRIKRVGAISAFSMEEIVLLNPDLVVLWGTGRAEKALGKFERLGLTVYVSDPRDLEDVPRSIRDFGKLTGNSVTAEKAAAEYGLRHQKLSQVYSSDSEISVLYQVWNKPIQTLNDTHIISEVIRLCGGQNAFGDSLALAPKISVESVVARNPDVIIASGMGEARPDWLDDWRKWKSLKSVEENNLYFIPPDIIQRHTPRILDGAAIMCEHLERARKKR